MEHLPLLLLVSVVVCAGAGALFLRFVWVRFSRSAWAREEPEDRHAFWAAGVVLLSALLLGAFSAQAVNDILDLVGRSADALRTAGAVVAPVLAIAALGFLERCVRNEALRRNADRVVARKAVAKSPTGGLGR